MIFWLVRIAITFAIAYLCLRSPFGTIYVVIYTTAVTALFVLISEIDKRSYKRRHIAPGFRKMWASAFFHIRSAIPALVLTAMFSFTAGQGVNTAYAALVVSVVAVFVFSCGGLVGGFVDHIAVYVANVASRDWFTRATVYSSWDIDPAGVALRENYDSDTSLPSG